jgi:hypothetical protein
MLWKTILAAMIWLQAPGQSLYSQVPVDASSPPAVTDTVNGVRAYRLLDREEDRPFACTQRGNPACSQPLERDQLYNLVRIGKAHTRAETYDEGVVRYAMIARVIAEVAEDEKRWSYPPGQLWRYLVTIAFHESGFRRDIHAGRGRAALGDCRSRRGPKGPVRIAGSCRSHGLFQTLFSSPKRTKHFGFGAEQVIGVDRAATKRATVVAASALERFAKGCEVREGVRAPICVFAGYGGVTAPRHPGIIKRAGTYQRLGRAPAKLDAYVSGLLR